jgi:NAD(P)-dependent dehydrogenase (short-subunit alcohol dehydrogenase family)
VIGARVSSHSERLEQAIRLGLRGDSTDLVEVRATDVNAKPARICEIFIDGINEKGVEMNICLGGRVALITGASRGIGFAIAQRLSEAGSAVMLVSRRDEGLVNAAKSLRQTGADVAWAVGHVDDPDAAKAVTAETVRNFGNLDILVNNAATNPYFGPLLDIDFPRARKTIEVNQMGLLWWSEAAVRLGMSRPGGVILNIASIGGIVPEPSLGWYNTTKAAVMHLTRQLAYELAPRVRVNALAPGLVRTDFARSLWEGKEAQAAAHIPLQRLGEPDDIARAAVFLCSDAASWVTGQTLVVDGGTTTQPTGGVVTE